MADSLNPFQQALASGLATVRKAAGQAARYQRGDDVWPTYAVPTQPDPESWDEDQGAIQTDSMDFLLAVEDLPFKPTHGDRIHANGRAWIVTGQNGQAPYTYSDSGRTSYRIHTVEAGSEALP